MTPIANTLDTVLNLCQRHIEKDGRLMAAEPLLNNPSGSGGVSNRILAQSLNAALLGAPANTTSQDAVQATQFSQYIFPQTDRARTVNGYKKHLRNLRAQLCEAYFRRTMDQTQAERLTSEAWRKLALPVWEE